jgi:cullin 1
MRHPSHAVGRGSARLQPGREAITFTAFTELLSVPEGILRRVLHSLSCGKYKVLKRITEEGGAAGGNATKNSDSFLFNEQFTCPVRKIRIPMASLEESHDIKRIEEDRSIAIEAAIVRAQLTAEVLAQLSFCKPDPKRASRL